MAKSTPKNRIDENNTHQTTTVPQETSETVLRGIQMSPSIVNLATALVKFQGEQSPAIVKDSEGYNYDYLSLAGLLLNVQPALKKNNLAIVQFPTNVGMKGLGVITLLMHNSGEYIQSEFVMPLPSLTSANVTQQAGAGITYARRYALAAVLRIAADEDTDGT